MSTPNPIDRFLLQEVESASPAKLHWLLLRRAHSLAVTIANLWKKQSFSEAQQWVVLVRDILNELLEGIVDPNHPLAKQQSDLYVFLSALLATAEHGRDQAAIEDLREILEIEMATWEMLVLRESSGALAPGGAVAPSVPPASFAAGSLDFSA